MKVLDSNDKPSDIDASSLSVDENTQGNTHVVFTVFDQDVGQSHSCYVNDSNVFDIDNRNNQSILRVKTRAAVDYEKDVTITSKFRW